VPPPRLPAITGNDPAHPTALPHDHAFWEGQTCRTCTDARDRDAGKRRGGNRKTQSQEVGRILKATVEERDGQRVVVIEAEAAGNTAEVLLRELETHGLTIFVELPEGAALS
jgi:hypothetical protein